MQSGFNPKARWDRRIPGQDNTHADQTRINVVAFFKNAKIFPRAFFLNNNTYEIKSITYTWQERCGRETIVYFSVNTGNDIYQISFNNTSFCWHLDKIISGP